MLIYRVDQVAVVKTSDEPLKLTIHAAGTTSSTGWTNPRLDPSGDPHPEDAILEFSFEADRPTGITAPVLTPVQATVESSPAGSVELVIVHARTNHIVVHASEFLAPIPPKPAAAQAMFTTLAQGEEGPSTLPTTEEHPTTLAVGEEGPTTLIAGEEGPTTLAVGEEHPTTFAVGEEGPTTLIAGEEGPTTFVVGEEHPTTLAVGEEGPTTLIAGEEHPTTLAIGEEGPTTFIVGEEHPTTLAFGEEGPTTFIVGEESNPYGGGSGPFGAY